MGVYLIIATRNLLQAKRRTLLLGLALGMVTALLVMLLALSQGISDTMIFSASTLSAGHVNVSGFYKVSFSDAAPIVTKRKELRETVKELVPDADLIIDRHRGWARIVSDASSMQVGLVGMNVEEEGRFFEAVQLVEGDARKLAQPFTVLLFARQAKRLDVAVGDTLTITIETFSGMTNTAELTIVAIAKDMGMLSNWNAYMSRETILKLYALQEDTTGAVMVYLKDVRQSEKEMGRIAQALRDRKYEVMEHEPQPFWMKFERVMSEDWAGQKMDLTTWKDEVNFLTWVLRAVDGVSAFLISILLVIIGIGIMNAMWIAVRERTGEVGTVRAIGMSRQRVLWMFLTEALLLGLVSTTIGALLGGGLALAIDVAAPRIPVDAVEAILMSDHVNMTVKPVQMVSAVIGFTLVSGLSALWPALRASRMQPVTAISHVG